MHRTGRALATTATLLLAASLAPGARAQGQSADKAAADALFEEARGLIEAGRPAEACPKLEESQRLDPAIGTALNLGDCWEKSGKLASASLAFADAAALAKRAGDAPRAEEAQRRVEALAPRLSKLAVIIPAASRIQGLAVTRDGRTLPPAQWGTPVPLDPGEHTVAATAPGRTPWKATTRLEKPGTTEVTVPVLPEPEVPAPKGKVAQRVAGVVVGSVGLAGIGVGIGLAVAAARTDTASKAYCLPEDPNKCFAKGVALRNEAITYADTSTVVTSVGAVALATGVTLFLLAGAPKSPDKPQRAWVVVPGASPEGASLAFASVW